MGKVTSTFEGIALGPNASGVYSIGGTNDVLYGGDMSGDAAGLGIPLVGTGATQQFALAVFADDGGTAVSSGWVSAGFFSYVNYAAQAAGSAIGLTGQVHIGANFTAGDNVVGVYGLSECDSAETISAHVFGGQFGVTASAGTFSANYRVAAVSLSASMNGSTTNGTVTGLQFMNRSAGGFDAAMSFGTVAGDITGTGADQTADASEDIYGHIKILVGADTCYINVYSDAS